MRLLRESSHGPGHPAARRVAAALAVACNHNAENQLALQVAGGLQVRGLLCCCVVAVCVCVCVERREGDEGEIGVGT